MLVINYLFIYMSKLCLTCKQKDNLKNNTYSTKKANWKQKRGLKTHFPNDNIPELKNGMAKEYYPKSNNQTKTLVFKKSDIGKYIIYYASDLEPDCDKIPSASVSYKNFKNKGVTRINKDGTAVLKFRCPNIYQEEKQTFYPHIHYLLTNKSNTKWIDKVYTKLVICDIDTNYLKKAINGRCTLILNALPIEYYIKDRIPGSLPLPYNSMDRLEMNDVKSYFKSMLVHYPNLNKKVNDKSLNILDIPIITYCYKSSCDASRKLTDILLKLGFKNIKEYKPGLVGWKSKANLK